MESSTHTGEPLRLPGPTPMAFEAIRSPNGHPNAGMLRVRSISVRHLRPAPVLLAIICLFLVAGCVPNAGSNNAASAPPSQQSSGPVTLTVWADAPRAKLLEQYKAPGVTLDIETMPNQLKPRIQKLVLANKAGKGWPDIFETSVRSARAFSMPPYSFAADMTPYLPEGYLDKFADVSLQPCKVDQKIVCLPNEVGPYVLWYNKPLMKKFGYSVPKTWEQYKAIGLDVAKNHPGYVVGASKFLDEAYLEPSRCPIQQLVGPKTVYSNLKDPKCLRAAGMVDSLLAAGSFARTGAADPTFIKKYGATGKWLMIVGPVWYSANVFKNQFEMPTGDLGMAPPLRWADENKAWTGNNGGVYYELSRHSHHMKQAMDVIKWMASGPNQTSLSHGTVPAYLPAQEDWVKNVAGDGYITASDGTVLSVIHTAVSNVVPNHSFLPVDGIRGQDVLLPTVQTGGTVAQGLSKWQKAIDNLAGAAGYKVVHSK